MGLTNDFCNDIQCILRKRHIKKMLGILNEQQSGGWEKWFQLELVRYYHDLEHEPHWECGFEKSLQHNPEKLINRLDLVYRKKNTNNNYYNGVEIKVQRFPQYSIKGILTDLTGVSHIKSSNWELRAVTGLSIYATDIIESVSDNSRYKSFVRRLISSKRAKVLKCNGWSCLILGWEANNISTPSTMKKEYQEYIRSIGEIASKYDIKMK